MAFARQAYVYRQYISNHRGGVSFPDSTWRRWLRQGKITREQLVELGIQPGQRRVFKRHVEPIRLGGPVRVSPTLPGGEIEYEGGELDASEVYPVDGDASVEESHDASTSAASAVDRSGIESTSDSVSESADVGAESDGYISPLSMLSEGEDSSSNSDCDPLTNANELASSVVESQNIGFDKLNEPLVPSLLVTKFETLLMILHLAMRHGYTDVFLEDMMSFVNQLVGSKNAVPKTKFLFNKLFMFDSRPTIRFFWPSLSYLFRIKQCISKRSYLKQVQNFKYCIKRKWRALFHFFEHQKPNSRCS